MHIRILKVVCILIFAFFALSFRIYMILFNYLIEGDIDFNSIIISTLYLLFRICICNGLTPEC